MGQALVAMHGISRPLKPTSPSHLTSNKIALNAVLFKFLTVFDYRNSPAKTVFPTRTARTRGSAHRQFSLCLAGCTSPLHTTTMFAFFGTTTTDGPPASKSSKYGLMCCSASPAVVEAVAAAGADWICLDAQHGAVSYDVLGNMLCSTSSHKAKRIVRVGGPDDRYGIQQALDLGADGVMVPLVNSKADAEQAVSYCYFPPEGQRSAAYPVRAVYPKGVGGAGLARYLQEANKEVEVWLQVETKGCLEAIDDVLSVPGITCAFLGPADMGLSLGYHVKHNYDLPAMLASSDMEPVYTTVVEACKKHKVIPGAFCLGEARAKQLSAQGFINIAYGTDTGSLMDYVDGMQKRLRSTAAAE